MAEELELNSPIIRNGGVVFLRNLVSAAIECGIYLHRGISRRTHRRSASEKERQKCQKDYSTRKGSGSRDNAPSGNFVRKFHYIRKARKYEIIKRINDYFLLARQLVK